jgi:hypothetical protein
MNSEKNLSYIFLFIILIYIFVTNSYFEYEKSLIYGGADGFSYYEISKFAPKLSSTKIQPIHAERFFFPYIIGIISKISSIEIYLLNRILVIVLILLINKYFIDIFLKFNKNIYTILLSLLILNLNPYITRFYIAVPLIINDLFFIYGSLLSISGLKDTNKKKFFFGLIISSFARQSAAAICLAILLTKVIQKDKFFLRYSEIILSFIIFIMIYFFGYIYSSLIPMLVPRSEQYFITIFGLFIESKTFKELFIFFVWPFLSFGPLLIFFIIFIKKSLINFKINLNINYFLIFFTLLIIMQPILQGVYVSGKNIIRLSTLAYPAVLTYLLINSKSENINKIQLIFFILILFVWSSHPTFSNFNFLEKFKF